MARQRFTNTFEIDFPASSSTVAVYENPETAKSTLAVRGIFDTLNAEVWVKVFPDASSVPATITNPGANGYTRMNLTAEVFSYKAVPGVTTSTFAVAAFQGPNLSGDYVGGPIADDLTAQLTDTLAINAKQSIWFTFAGDNYPGYPNSLPQPESGEEYRPQIFYVPSGKSNVIVSATGTWGHCPGCLSGPDGNGQQRSLERDWYAQNNNAGNITQVQAADSQLNSLVGMWLTGSSTTATEIKFGASNTVAIPSGATMLVLALHDGYEWSNNVDAVQATVTWS